MTPYKIEAGTGQHIGDRPEQQDRIGLFSAPRAPGYMMAILADGMGGASGGAIAAEQAIRTARQIFDNFSPITDDVESMLREIVSESHTVIQLMTLASEKRPHSTLVALVITPERVAFWGHVGNSRLYRFSGPNLVERTVDHSSEVPAASPTQASAKTGRERPSGVLLNVLGDPRITPAITLGRHAQLAVGDAFMLCSDGLWQYFDDAEYGAAISVASPRDASQMLLHRARERATGGDADNCTIGIVKLVTPPRQAPEYQVGKMRRAV